METKSNALVVQYRFLPPHVVAKRIEAFPSLVEHRDDLVQDGMLGLVAASRAFDTARRNNFMSYAYPCVLNAVNEGIRRYVRVAGGARRFRADIQRPLLEDDLVVDPPSDDAIDAHVLANKLRAWSAKAGTPGQAERGRRNAQIIKDILAGETGANTARRNAVCRQRVDQIVAEVIKECDVR